MLEAACRTRPTLATAAPCSEDATVPSEPLDLAGLAAVVRNWLLMEDDAHLAVVVGAVLAHRLGGAPVWLLIVGPPSSAKSELLRTFVDCPGIYPLSDLSARTFVSGLKAADADPTFHGSDPSLLARLKTEVLVFKDLTTMLEKRSEERQGRFSRSSAKSTMAGFASPPLPPSEGSLIRAAILKTSLPVVQ